MSHPPTIEDRAATAGSGRTRTTIANPWIGGLIGLLLGALVTATTILLTVHPAAAPSGTTGGPLTAPSELPGFTTYRSAVTALDADKGAAEGDRVTDEDTRTAEQLSEAYGGAAGLARRYADRQLEQTFLLVAVRANTPGPWVAYQDAARLGLVRAPEEVRRIGEVSCLIANQPTNAGGTPADDTVNVVLCQRAARGLTVQIRYPGGDLRNRPEQTAELIDTVWSQLS
ncbi:hypothetical protein AB0D08_02695 [Kitasatospora sp. NPDC048540]|uniref:hypothetical protein n=1 Tax=Kitasatospora sp. NPDC048540 TaxID=3155634 RepID=UPI0033EE968A